MSFPKLQDNFLREIRWHSFVMNIINNMESKDNTENEDLKILKHHTNEHKHVCDKCGNDSWRVYIKIVIDDAELICTKCGNHWY